MNPLAASGWSVSLGLLALAAACGASYRGATDGNLAQARARAADGARAVARECASCHGDRGQGVRAPAIIGPGALPELPRERGSNLDPAAADPELMRARQQTRPAGAPWRDPFRTAEDLFLFASTRMPMPKDKQGTLAPEEYWEIVNFVLIAHGVDVPAGGVTAQNAASVKMQ